MSATTEAATETTIAPKPLVAGPMGPWTVVVHNDNVNTFDFVIRCLRDIARLELTAAIIKTNEIHDDGAARVAFTHREHAELISERLVSRGLTATIERA